MSRRSRPSTALHRHGRTALAVATGVACAAALAVAPASAGVDSQTDGRHAGRIPVLKGTVGPGFTISINKDSVPAGKYKLVVQDKGTIHNFHILGAGVDKKTGIPETGKTVFKIKLKAGVYTVQCDAHSTTMKTTLTVT